MRILLLAPHPFFSQRGTPLAERMLLRELAAAGHEVEVLTFPEGDDPGIPGCVVHRVRALPGTRGVRPGFSAKKLALDAAMLAPFLTLLRSGRFDVVHAVEESAFLARLGKLLFGVPYVYDMDSGLARQMADRFPALGRVRRLLDACERWAVRGSCGTLAVCADLEETARAHHPGGLVARLEDPSLLEEGGGEAADLVPPEWEGLPLVLYVGNLQSYQGIDLLLAGFAQAAAEVPEARLCVVGGDAESIALYRGEAGRLGIAERVWFAGPRPVSQLAACLRRATVLASPRVHGANTPMKLYSYLDSGRPVLATRLPTHTQVLDDGVALLVEPTPSALGDGIAKLLLDGELRERLAASAAELARREFTPEAFRRKLLGFYGEVAERIGRLRGGDHGETAGLEARHPGLG